MTLKQPTLQLLSTSVISAFYSDEPQWTLGSGPAGLFHNVCVNTFQYKSSLVPEFMSVRHSVATDDVDFSNPYGGQPFDMF